MKNMAKKSKEKMTLEKLAAMVQRGFLDISEQFGAKIDELRAEMNQRFNAVEHRLEKLENDVYELKAEAREIKYLLQQKASREELQEIDERLTKIELRLKKSGV
ncbi:TPA: hypothetical protein DCZ14_01120 [Candidatus Azambacteria bacterium]|uniref:Uncharacterized protein n=1 Tax=Candidatus Azambacteria bacterium GW2011_GWC1_46_13 TaxID=1618619 RepID=A0A0G1RJ94_9BACT|nr:MAG: hypothetical protein UX33_C0032G0009 [Candidatus Azambacteria bacterium GW2011_GWC1_46_13]HBC59003.1 hypothetical protein [Candidatus Azambacteria bacterium]